MFDLALGGELMIGHRATASVAIDDPWVSWDHARIYFRGADCHIEDLNSTNGTYVNCVRVKHEELRHEDIIFLGKTHVLFLAPSASSADPFVVADSGLGMASDHAFVSGSGSPPLIPAAVDPFAAAASADADFGLGQNPFAGAAGKDPFASGGVDPFASGADYSEVHPPTAKLPTGDVMPGRGDLAISQSYERQSHAEGKAGAFDPSTARVPRAVSNPFSDDPISSGVLQASFGGGFEPNALTIETLQAEPGGGFGGGQVAARSPFAETRGDESLSPLADPPRRKASRSLSLSQLDDDGEPELPAPSPREIVDLLEASGRRKRGAMSGSDLGLSDELDALPESEMRTREIDTAGVADIIAEHEARERGPATAPEPAFDPPPGTESTHADIMAQVAAEQGDAALAAYERARLQNEVTRLRLALQAVQAENPQAVQLAAHALRDQELGRLANRVAELERDRAELRQTLVEREGELNEVTEDMIEKEDRIDQLEHRLASGRQAKSPDDYTSLEF